MIRLLICSALIAIGCGCFVKSGSNANRSQVSTTPELQLPVVLRCDHFPEWNTTDSANRFFGKITGRESTLLLTKRKNGESPVLVVINKKGKTLDSVVLFEKHCYCVTAIQCYRPTVEISKELNITVVDTTYETHGSADSSGSVEGQPHYYIEYTPKITKRSFRISDKGKIIPVQ